MLKAVCAKPGDDGDEAGIGPVLKLNNLLKGPFIGFRVGRISGGDSYFIYKFVLIQIKVKVKLYLLFNFGIAKSMNE